MTFKMMRTFATAFLLGAAPAVLVTGSAHAAAAITNPAVGKPLEEAKKFADAKQWKEALAKAQEARNASGISAQDGALVDQLIAAYAVQARDFQTALAAYDKMIAAGTGDRTKNLQTAMQIALNLKNTQKAIGYANQLGNNLTDADRRFVAQAHYQSGNYQEVVRMLQPATSGAQPNKDALELLRATYVKMNNEASARQTLELLTLHYPSPDYWNELLRVARRQPGKTPHQDLELYRLRAATANMKTAEDYSEMAQIAIQLGLPTEAKSALDKAAEAKLLAGERSQRLINMTNDLVGKDPAALAQLEKDAAANIADGNADVKLAEAYWTYGRFPEAEAAIRRGIQEGKLTDADEAKIILGHILRSQGKRQEAVTAYNSVAKDSKQAGIARLWSIQARQA